MCSWELVQILSTTTSPITMIVAWQDKVKILIVSITCVYPPESYVTVCSLVTVQPVSAQSFGSLGIWWLYNHESLLSKTEKSPNTIGFRFFAECLRHLAKAKLHSAKPLPSAALGKEHTAKNWSAKPSLPSVFYRHSAKKNDRHGAGPVDGGFAECQPCRHSAKFRFFLKKIFAECPLAGTRQSLNFF